MLWNEHAFASLFKMNMNDLDYVFKRKVDEGHEDFSWISKLAHAGIRYQSYSLLISYWSTCNHAAGGQQNVVVKSKDDSLKLCYIIKLSFTMFENSLLFEILLQKKWHDGICLRSAWAVHKFIPHSKIKRLPCRL